MSIDAEVPLDKIYSKFPFFDVPSTALWKKSNATFSLQIEEKKFKTLWRSIGKEYTHTQIMAIGVTLVKNPLCLTVFPSQFTCLMMDIEFPA